MPNNILRRERLVDPVLTNIMLGYKQASLIADFISPVISVTQVDGSVVQFGDEVYKNYNTKRAVGADSNVVQPTSPSLIPYHLDEDEFSFPVDDQMREATPFDLQMRGATFTMGVLLSRLEKEVAVLAQNPNNYPTGHKVVCTTNGAGNTPYCWSDRVNSNPLIDVENGKQVIEMATGVSPNVLVLGNATYHTLRHHPQLLEETKHTTTGGVTLNLIKLLFDIPQVYIGKAIKATDKSVKSYIWSDVAILAYVPGGPALYEPAFMYSYRMEEFPVGDMWYHPNGKIDYIRATDKSQPFIVSPSAGYLISNTVA